MKLGVKKSGVGMSCNHNKAEVKRHVAGEHGENELKAFKIRDVKAWKERFEEKNPKGHSMITVVKFKAKSSKFTANVSKKQPS